MSPSCVLRGPAERLNRTEFTQPALLVSSVAALKLFEPVGIKPVAVAGHSLGEYSALVAAGGVSFRDAVGLVQKRGRYMAEAVPRWNRSCRCAAGFHRPTSVKDVCRMASSVGVRGSGKLQLTWPGGHCRRKGGVERAIELAKARAVKRRSRCRSVCRFILRLMQQAADRLAEDLAGSPGRTSTCRW